MTFNTEATYEQLYKTLYSTTFYQKIQKLRWISGLTLVCSCFAAVVLIIVYIFIKSNRTAGTALISTGGALIGFGLIYTLIQSIINVHLMKKFTLNRYKDWTMKFYVLATENSYDLSLHETAVQNIYEGYYNNQKFVLELLENTVKVTKISSTNNKVIEIDNSRLDLFKHKIDFSEDKLSHTKAEMYSECNKIVARKLTTFIEQDFQYLINEAYGNN